MTALETISMSIRTEDDTFAIDEAQLGAAAFLARYSGRTLDAYRRDLRMFFAWAAEHGLAALRA